MYQTGFEGLSHPVCTLASKAALIINSAVENRLEHLNKTDLKPWAKKLSQGVTHN